MPDTKHPVLLQVRDLCTEFVSTDQRPLMAVDHVSFDVARGECVALVGESGSGKTATALSLMRLLDATSRIEGEIIFDGVDLLRLSSEQMCALRGNKLAMVFQEPMTSLNPVLSAGEQVAEVLRHHQGLSDEEARRQTIELFRRVQLPAPEQRLGAFPHQLSGGMCQRVMIAMALACKPSLLIADEPTTALDATVQAQLLCLLAELQHELQLAILFISHDLAAVARLCQRVVVLYAGQVVESGPTEVILADPWHPYTAALLRSLPDSNHPRSRLPELPTSSRDPRQVDGCRFSDRCPLASSCSSSTTWHQEGDHSARCCACRQGSGDTTSEGT